MKIYGGTITLRLHISSCQHLKVTVKSEQTILRFFFFFGYGILQ